jgi:hypothetical protein
VTIAATAWATSSGCNIFAFDLPSSNDCSYLDTNKNGPDVLVASLGRHRCC